MQKKIRYEISGYALESWKGVNSISRTEFYEGDDYGKLLEQIRHDFITARLTGSCNEIEGLIACARLEVTQISEIEFEGQTYSRKDRLSDLEMGDGQLLEDELSKEEIEQYEDDLLWDV